MSFTTDNVLQIHMDLLAIMMSQLYLIGQMAGPRREVCIDNQQIVLQQLFYI